MHPVTETPIVKLLIADDHPLVILGVRRALETDERIEIVGEAHTGPELMALVERRAPSVVLLDLWMPGVAGTECIEQIHEQWPQTTVIVLSGSDDRESIDAALHAGASAYIVKSAFPTDIASVIRQASTGAVFHAPSRAAPTEAADEGPRAVALTAREQAVLDGVVAGMTTSMISESLWVSEHTVKFHLTNIYRKLGVANRAGAVRYALEHDMVARGGHSAPLRRPGAPRPRPAPRGRCV